MTDQIKVRFADEIDLDGCIALDHSTMLTVVIKRKVTQREIIVAEKSGQLVGYLCLEYLWSLVPYIALIWVVEDQRRQGIGKPYCAIWKTSCVNKGTRHCTALRKLMSRYRSHGTGAPALKNVALSPA